MGRRNHRYVKDGDVGVRENITRDRFKKIQKIVSHNEIRKNKVVSGECSLCGEPDSDIHHNECRVLHEELGSSNFLPNTVLEMLESFGMDTNLDLRIYNDERIDRDDTEITGVDMSADYSSKFDDLSLSELQSRLSEAEFDLSALVQTSHYQRLSEEQSEQMQSLKEDIEILEKEIESRVE